MRLPDALETLLLAYVALALALVSSIALHPANPFTVAVMVAGTLLVAVGARQAARGAGDAGPTPSTTRSPLWSHGALAILAACPPLQSPADGAPDGLREAMAAVSLLSLVLLVVHASGGTRARRAAVIIIVVAKLALLLAGPLFIPRPTIDVWHLNQSAADQLVHGTNPYTTPVDDLYQGHFAYSGRQTYSYPPLNLLLSLPSWALLGDYRYGLVLALGGALLLLAAAGRRLGASSSLLELVTLALVLHPQLDRLIIHGWTEPYLLLGAAAFLYLHARRPAGALALIALAGLPLIKQYTAVPVLLCLVAMRPRPRVLLGAGATVALLAAPLLVLLGPSTVVQRGLLFFVQHVWFRGDSISLPASLHRIGVATSWEPGVPFTLLIQLLAGGVAAFALRARGAAGALLASSLALLAGFLFAPQAFLNYYLFSGALLLVALPGLGPQLEWSPGGEARRPRAVSSLAVVLGVASLVAATSLSVRVIDFLVDCSHDAAKARARLARGGAVLDGGSSTAGPDDTIHLCEARHFLGPLCHDDLVCVCARSGALAEEVSQWLREETHAPSSCRLDEPHPSADDNEGACRRARCDLHAAIP